MTEKMTVNEAGRKGGSVVSEAKRRANSERMKEHWRKVHAGEVPEPRKLGWPKGRKRK